MSKRALRRHHRARLRQRAFKNLLWGWEGVVPMSKIEDWARRRGDTWTICSCSSCGNPRNHGGFIWPALTRQEIVSDLDFKEQLKELSYED